MKNLILALCLLPYCLSAQFQKVEQITWGERINAPIKIEVTRNNGKLIFSATNSSYYPYRVELEFKGQVNLSPMMSKYEQIVNPGLSRLIEFQVVRPNEGFDYTYSVKYQLGNPDDEPELKFPYLFPIAKGKTIQFHVQQSPDGLAKFRNLYSTQEGDTIFAIRKGIVTSLPNNSKQVDRFLIATVEILHADGTVAIYKNVDPEVFVKHGDKVFPGQPLGIVLPGRPIDVSVFGFQKDGRIVSIEHFFALNETELISSRKVEEGMIVDHPIEIIKKELTKRELKKLGQPRYSK